MFLPSKIILMVSQVCRSQKNNRVYRKQRAINVKERYLDDQ